VPNLIEIGLMVPEKMMKIKMSIFTLLLLSPLGDGV
jgi:hypothetical protein